MNSYEDCGISKFPQIPSHSPKSNSNSKGNASKSMNSQYANLRLDVEEMSRIVSFEVHRAVASPRPRITRSMSLTKLSSPKLKRASDSGCSHGDGGGIIEPPISTRELAQRSMHRSYSVPVIREDGSVSLHGKVVRLISTSPQMGKEIVMTPFKSPAYGSVHDSDKSIEDSGEQISEEAVCRICLVELENGPECMKMECKCKGELAVAHQECAIKWFSTKGNRICDVCRQEVQNLPITLLRAHAVETYNFQDPADITQYRVWHDVPFLIIINMLAYFGFLEQLLAGKMGSSALAISLPFSCIFGVLASMSAATMVWKQYIWIYAFVQLAFVIAFSHFFYSKLQMQAILAILLATFSGFGVTMTITTLLDKILRRTRPWLNQSTHQTPSAMQLDHRWTLDNHDTSNASISSSASTSTGNRGADAASRSRHSQIHLPPHQDIEMGTSVTG